MRKTIEEITKGRQTEEMMNEITQFSEYKDWLSNLKQEIKQRQSKAVLAINSELIMLYWDLGRQILEKQKNNDWGSKFMELLSKDLLAEFPDMKGFSKRNLELIRQWFLYYNTENKSVPIAKQLVSQLALIPWGHHILIIQRTKNTHESLFYISKTVENNWSRSVLEYQIETNLYERQGKAISNFKETLPSIQSDLANELLKDPYHFDFLQLSEKVRETELEKSLVAHISHFLLELGKGFAYMGRQYRFKIGNKEYRSDLVFYQTKLKCYIIIELKTREFEPEFIGKLNYYISGFNALVKEDNDNPTIGILLCKNKDSYEVEFALKDINKPIGVSSYRYTQLTEEIKNVLPSEEQLQNELRNFNPEKKEINE